MSRYVLIIVENAPVPFDSRVWKEALPCTATATQVIVLSPRAKGYETRYEVIDGIHIYRHPMPKERDGARGIRAWNTAVRSSGNFCMPGGFICATASR